MEKGRFVHTKSTAITSFDMLFRANCDSSGRSSFCLIYSMVVERKSSIAVLNSLSSAAGSSSIAGATASIVSSVIADYPVPVDRLTQDEKMEIMDALNRKGVFLLKGSVSHVARELHSSEASIYRYLGKLNNKD